MRTWDLFVELRKELVESQKIRSQILGFKITFISAFVALLGSANSDGVLFVMPAFASVCFDYVIHSYSFSIKRIGRYVKLYIEPQLIESGEFKEGFTLWESYLKDPKTQQNLLVMYANFGLTLLAAVLAVYYLLHPFIPKITPVLVGALLVALAIEIYIPFSMRKLRKIKKVVRNNSMMSDKYTKPQ